MGSVLDLYKQQNKNESTPTIKQIHNSTKNPNIKFKKAIISKLKKSRKSLKSMKSSRGVLEKSRNESSQFSLSVSHSHVTPNSTKKSKFKQ